jgi:excisionase family DNA binding protein
MDNVEDSSRDWMTVAEMARALGVSEMTIYREIAANRFPAVRIGRRLLIPTKALERLAEAALATGRVVSAEDFFERTD